MAKQTSIHLRPCKQSSEIHNKREKALDYVRSDLSPLNEWWSAVPSLGERRSQISALVKEKTGRKMQAKAEPLREGVVVIKEDTTMEELQELGKRFQERFGVTPVQIAIHKDEGHWQGEVWKPNLHAHIVFDWYDHSTGKSIKTTSLDAIEMQTICAEVLGMERGVSSEKKHLEASRYKAQARQKELEALQKERDEVVAKREETERMTETLREESKDLQLRKQTLEEDIENLSESLHVKAEGIVKGTAQGVADWFTGKSKRRAKKAEENEAKTKAEASAKIKAIRDKCAAKEKLAEDKITEADRTITQYTSWKKSHQANLDRIEDYKKRAVTAENRLRQLEQSVSLRETLIEKFIRYGVCLKEQWNRLFNGETVQSNHIVVRGQHIPLDNPLHMRLEEGHRLMLHDQHWVTEQGFWNGIKKGLTKVFEKGSQAYAWVRQQLGHGRYLGL